MRLSSHTDYGLRLLMDAAARSPRPVSIEGAAFRFNVSRHHLMKVAQNLSRAGYIEPVRGRSGGFRLARPSAEIRLGDVVRTLESELGLVECQRPRGTQCPVISACRIPAVLNRATAAFFDVLDEVNLDDLVHKNRPMLQILEVAQ